MGSGPEVLDARLRYRVNQGHLKLRIELHRPLDVLERAFLDRVQNVEKAVGADLVYYGDAPDELTPIAIK